MIKKENYIIEKGSENVNKKVEEKKKSVVEGIRYIKKSIEDEGV